MYATIFYERGVKPAYIDAAQLAYEAIGSVSADVPEFTIKPLPFQLPLLYTGQVDGSFIDRVAPADGVSALFITERDMAAEGLAFCIGRSAYDRRVAVVSTNRIRESTMLGLSLHEIGHSEGLVAECSSQYDRVSIFAGHCVNTCVMEPVNNISEMDATVSKFMSSPLTAGFCQPCATDLAR